MKYLLVEIFLQNISLLRLCFKMIDIMLQISQKFFFLFFPGICVI